jgi:pyruvate formate lyase activating enzyme
MAQILDLDLTSGRMLNDNDENILRTAELALSHGVKRMCLLPYHRAGIEKYRSLDRHYTLENVQSPLDEKMRKMKDKLIKLGLDVKIGGG